MTAGALARRRAAALVVADGLAPSPSPSPVAVLEEQVADLALPLAPKAVVPLLRAGVPLVAVIALLVGGAVGLIAVIVGCGVGALLVVRSAPARRAAADDRLLPEVLERVARHLRSGGNLRQAVTEAAPPANGRGPGLAHDWAAVVASIPSLGVAGAVDAWATSPRARPSVRLAAAALALAADTGGSPARAVDGVAATLRSRLALAEEIRALTSQARASAMVIALAPIVFGVLASATDDRTAAFFASPAGVTIAIVGLTLDAVGAWWMVHLCRPAAGDDHR